MEKYIHKPTVIHALKIDDKSMKNKKELKKMGVKYINYDPVKRVSLYMIKTIEGNMFAHTGDYIVRGTYDEVYPVKKEIFEDIYERIDNATKT